MPGWALLNIVFAQRDIGLGDLSYTESDSSYHAFCSMGDLLKKRDR